MAVTQGVQPTLTIPPLRIESPQQAAEYIKVLVYGIQGMGKTYFVGTAEDVPSMRNVFIADYDKGMMTLAALGRGSHLKTVQLEAFSGYWKGTEYIPGITDIYKFLTEQPHEYKTIVIDGVRAMQELCHEQVMKEAAARERRDPEVPQQQDYGRVASRMKLVLQRFVSLPMNVIMTCQEQSMQNQLTMKMSTRPHLQESLALLIPGLFDVVLHLDVAVKMVDGKSITTRLAQCQPDGQYVAKDRSGRLGSVIEDPTMGYIHDRVTAALAVKPTTTTKVK